LIGINWTVAGRCSAHRSPAIARIRSVGMIDLLKPDLEKVVNLLIP
jgi:hypothetical protein